MKQGNKLFSNTKNWKPWISIAFLVKGILFLFFLSQHRFSWDFKESFAVYGGDSESYVAPFDTFAEGGSFDPGYRMPGYGLFYLPIRLLVNKTITLDLIVLLQFIFSVLSVYCLARSAEYLFKSRSIFYPVYFLYLFSCYVSGYDFQILTESFSTSALIFHIYFFARALHSGKKINFIISGFFIVWSYFLRPVGFALMAIAPLLLAIFYLRDKKVFYRTGLLMILIPFFVIQSAWTAYNYQNKGKLFLLTEYKYYPNNYEGYNIQLWDFIKSWGGDFKLYAGWFIVSSNGSYPGQQVFYNYDEMQLPERCFTSVFTHEKAIELKREMEVYDKATDPVLQKKQLTLVRNELAKYTESIKNEKPFLYYINSRLILTATFFKQSGSGVLMNKPWTTLSSSEKIFKVIMSIPYMIILPLGLLGCALILFRYLLRFPVIFAASALYLSFIFPFVLGTVELRYLVPAYPFLLVAAAYFYCTSPLFKKLRPESITL